MRRGYNTVKPQPIAQPQPQQYECIIHQGTEPFKPTEVPDFHTKRKPAPPDYTLKKIWCPITDQIFTESLGPGGFIMTGSEPNYQLHSQYCQGTVCANRHTSVMCNAACRYWCARGYSDRHSVVYCPACIKDKLTQIEKERVAAVAAKLAAKSIQ
jgi:hypothetical protein